MDSIVITLHSVNRWIIVIVALITAIKFLIGWLGNHSYRAADRGLMNAYTGLLDLQVLLGIILLFTRGLANYQIEHAITLVVAVILAHLARMWRDREYKIKFRNNFLVIVVGLLLIVLGVARLPIGWTLAISSS